MTGLIGNIERINNDSYVGAVSICGWALDATDGFRAPKQLVVQSSTGDIIGKTTTFFPRPDVAEAYHNAKLELCGFEIYVEKRDMRGLKLLFVCQPQSNDRGEQRLDAPICLTAELLKYNPYRTLIMEPSSVCNARCTWCTTGRRNSLGKWMSSSFLTAAAYAKRLDYLLENGILSRDAFIVLYNWASHFLLLKSQT